MRAIGLCLLLLASCSHGVFVGEVRLINEGSFPSSIVTSGGEAIVSTLDPHSHSTYERVNSSVLLMLDSNDDKVPFFLPWDLGAKNHTVQRFTVFVTQRSGALPNVMPLRDITEQREDEGIDIVHIRVLNAYEFSDIVRVSGVTTDCYRCLRPKLTDIPWGSASWWLAIDAKHSFELAFEGLNASAIARSDLSGSDPQHPITVKQFSWWEHGIYTVVIQSNDQGSMYDIVDVDGNNTWIPLGIAILIVLLVLLIIRIIYTYGIERWLLASDEADDDDDLSDRSRPHVVGGRDLRVSKPSGPGRVESIDAFRGIALAIMIGVNYGGGAYWFLDHSKWNGLTVADTVFPAFVFTSGASMALSLHGQRKRGKSKCQMAMSMAWRALKLLAVGLFLNNGMVLSNWRMPGVLQYFAVVVLVVSWIAIFVPKLNCNSSESSQVGDNNRAATSLNTPLMGLDQSRPGLGDVEMDGSAAEDSNLTEVPEDAGCCVRHFGDTYPYALEWIVILGLEALYLCVQFMLPVPGCPTGYLGPGGIGDYGQHPNCTGGAHRLVDTKLFGESHMYHNLNLFDKNHPTSAATCADTYDCAVYDPEGTLGAINAVIIAYLGLMAGRILLSRQSKAAHPTDEDLPGRGHRQLLVRWVLWGLVLGAIGTGLAGGKKNGGIIPINKNLWSTSFITVMAGVSFLFLSFVYVLVDFKHWWGGSPFRFLGKNPIIVYAGSEIFQFYFPFTVVNEPLAEGEFRSHSRALATNIAGVAIWIIIAFMMYRKRIFVKL